MFFVLPLRIDRPLRSAPIAVFSLIALCAMLYAGTAADIDGAATAFGFRVSATAWYTWFTSLFLHVDLWSHLVWNMYFLWLFGGLLEDVLGRARFLGIYFGGGLVACLAHAAMVRLAGSAGADLPVIGASGAVAAVMGVCALRFVRNKISIGYFVWLFPFVPLPRWGVWHISAVVGLGLWLAQELVSGALLFAGVETSVANWAHIGGFLFGLGIAKTIDLNAVASTEFLLDEARRSITTNLDLSVVYRLRTIVARDPDAVEARELLARSLSFFRDGAWKEHFTCCIRHALVTGDRSRAAQLSEEYFRLGGDPADLPGDVAYKAATALEGTGRDDMALELYDHVAQAAHPTVAENAVYRLVKLAARTDVGRALSLLEDRGAPFAQSALLVELRDSLVSPTGDPANGREDTHVEDAVA